MDVEKYSNILSYTNILNERKNFVRNASMYDEPANYFFKVLFYFDNPGEEDGFTSNLLGLDLSGDVAETDMGGGYSSTWKPKTYYKSKNESMVNGSESAAVSKNTAYNYLMINGELERADYLKDFILLLSEISAESPWYFKSVEGLDSAVERPYFKEFKLPERKSITINCIEDSTDMRITTLLELYRAACFSARYKKEIVPENLRKFDMGIYIFQDPREGLSYNNIEKTIRAITDLEDSSSVGYAGAKYFEFIGCEIDADSVKSSFSSVDNEHGTAVEPKIVISYDDCYTSLYNEHLCKSIGDMVFLDIASRKLDESDIDSINLRLTEPSILKKSPEEHLDTVSTKKKTSLSKMLVDNTVGKLENLAKGILRKAYLGNVYGLSVSNYVGNVRQLKSGDLIGGALSTARNIGSTVKSISQGNVVHDLLPSLQRRNQSTGSTHQLGNVNSNNVHKDNIKRNL